MDNIEWAPGMTLEMVEKAIIEKAFRFYQGNKTATAHALGIAIRTLDTKLEKYDADNAAAERHTEERRANAEREFHRARGYDGAGEPVSPSKPTAEVDVQPGKSAAAGVRVESTVEAGTESAMPLSVRPEVQSVSSKSASAGSSRRNR